MAVLKCSVYMCQISLHTEFLLPVMFKTSPKGLALHVSQPFKGANIIKFYLLVLDDTVS